MASSTDNTTASGKSSTSSESSSAGNQQLRMPWYFGTKTPAFCQAVLRSTNTVGDFVVTDDREHHTTKLHVNVPGAPAFHNLVAVQAKTGEVHPAVVERCDSENDSVLVKWVENEQVQSERVPVRRIKGSNPRLFVRQVVRDVPMNTEEDGLDQLRQTIGTLQKSGVDVFSPTLDDNCHVTLGTSCKCWSHRSSTSVPCNPTVEKDTLLAIDMSRSTVDALFSEWWCLTGDFLLRHADETEKHNCKFVVSLLGAIRVHHFAIRQNPQGLFVIGCRELAGQEFASPGDIVDALLKGGRADSVPVRRIVQPDMKYLSRATSEKSSIWTSPRLLRTSSPPQSAAHSRSMRSSTDTRASAGDDAMLQPGQFDDDEDSDDVNRLALEHPEQAMPWIKSWPPNDSGHESFQGTSNVATWRARAQSRSHPDYSLDLSSLDFASQHGMRPKSAQEQLTTYNAFLTGQTTSQQQVGETERNGTPGAFSHIAPAPPANTKVAEDEGPDLSYFGGALGAVPSYPSASAANGGSAVPKVAWSDVLSRNAASQSQNELDNIYG